MKKGYLLLGPLIMAMACAEVPPEHDHHGYMASPSGDAVQIIPRKPEAKVEVKEKERKPFLSSLPYFCDPYEYPLNIVLMAAPCRPFLPGLLKDGFPNQNLRRYR